MSNIKTISVPHLGGIQAAYCMPHAYDSSKPALVLINPHPNPIVLSGRTFTSMTTSNHVGHTEA